MNTQNAKGKIVRSALVGALIAASTFTLHGALQTKEPRRIQAHVIARDATDQPETIRIDRGSDHGVQRDMPVVSENGVVGKTFAVGRDFAVVMLITHNECKVAARVDAARQGIVNGAQAAVPGQAELGLSFLPRTAGLRTGEKVFTSGTGGTFPAGLLIGSVKDFQIRELDGYATIVPAVDATKLKNVFVQVGKE